MTLHDGSCVRLRAAHKDHVWSYDFVHERTHDGRAFRLLTLLDEYTRECLAIEVQRQMNHQDVLDQLAELFVDRGVPEYIRSDNGSEFTAQAVRDWLKAVGVRTLYIEPGSPWENGYVESFNGKLRNELLNVEVFDTLWEAKVLAEVPGPEFYTMEWTSNGPRSNLESGLVPGGRSEYLDRWLRDYANQKVGAKTLERYQEIVRNHLKPHLGGVSLPNYNRCTSKSAMRGFCARGGVTARADYRLGRCCTATDCSAQRCSRL